MWRTFVRKDPRTLTTPGPVGAGRRAWVPAALLAALVAPLATLPSAAGATAAETSIVIPVGPEGVTYRAPQGEDDGEWLGPPALDVGPDGRLWVDDLYGNRLLRYGTDGTRAEPLDLERHDVLSAMDIAVGADVVHVLDVDPRAHRYRVLTLTPTGRALSTHEVPEGYRLEDGLSGIDLDGDGSLLLELAGGSRLVQLLDPAGQLRLAERDGYTAHGRRYAVQFSGQPFAPVTVVAGGVSIEVRADHGTGGVRFVGATPNGDFFLSVEEVHFGDRIDVDQTVRHYSAAGRLDRKSVV